MNNKIAKKKHLENKRYLNIYQKESTIINHRLCSPIKIRCNKNIKLDEIINDQYDCEVEDTEE